MRSEIGARDALAIISAARGHAETIGVRVSIAVVDAGGNLKAFLRMDGAELAGPALAIDKAYTAVAHRMPTHELATLAQPGDPLFGLHGNAGGRYVVFGGGIPILAGGAVVGAIGVSGASIEEDIACAGTGAATALDASGPAASEGRARAEQRTSHQVS